MEREHGFRVHYGNGAVRRMGKSEEYLRFGAVTRMGKSEEYRRFAEQCLKMASATSDEKTRALFMQMAQVWFRLAEEKGPASDEPGNGR